MEWGELLPVAVVILLMIGWIFVIQALHHTRFFNTNLIMYIAINMRKQVMRQITIPITIDTK